MKFLKYRITTRKVEQSGTMYHCRMKKLVRKALALTSYEVINRVRLNNLFLDNHVSEATKRWTRSEVPAELGRYILGKLVTTRSYSQLQQELLSLYISDVTNTNQNYFVEFGACDGLTYSNTYYLEKIFKWRGILAEPDSRWHHSLRENRNVSIDNRCVWKTSGCNLRFTQEADAEYSSIKGSKNSAYLSNRHKETTVESVSLFDLLIHHNAPTEISYLSIDTEGSELEILQSFDFSRYTFNLITVEHNYCGERREIFDLLVSKGYGRIFTNVSLFDDWYINLNVWKHLQSRGVFWELEN
jgi:FkbM family methyltransferase